MTKMRNVSLSVPEGQLDAILKYRDYLQKKHKIKLGTSAVWLHLVGKGLETSSTELWKEFERAGLEEEEVDQ